MLNTEDRELIVQLERLGRVEPSSDAARQAIERARAAVELHASDRSPGRLFLFVQSRRGRWLTGLAAAAAAAIAILGLWPGRSGDGIAWAEVVRQIETARTLRLSIMIDDHPGLRHVATIYVKAPDRVREEHLEPQRHTQVFNGDEMVEMNPLKKLYRRVPQSSPLRRVNRAEWFLQTFAGIRADITETSLAVGDDDYELTFAEDVEREGRRLEKYALNTLGQPRRGQSTDGAQYRQYCWFEPVDGRLVLMTRERLIDGRWSEVAATGIELNVEIPDDLFSVTKPADYEDVDGDSPHATMSLEVRAVTNAYLQARHAISQYRLVAWQTSLAKPGVQFRAMRSRSMWRTEEYRASKVWVDPAMAFEEVWRALDSELPWQIVMPGPDPEHVNSLVQAKNRQGRFEKSWHTIVYDAFANNQVTLEDLGWPRLPSDSPSTRIVEPCTEYQMLPQRPDRPGLIGIRAQRNQPPVPQMPDQAWSIEDFWIDPDRDFLCVYRALHVRRGQPWQDNPNWVPDEPEGNPKDRANMGPLRHEYDHETRITEFGRTPEGRWYPAEFERKWIQVNSGKRYAADAVRQELYIRLDTAGVVPDAAFAWPEDAADSAPQ